MRFLLTDRLTWLAVADPAGLPADATAKVVWTNMPSSWRVFVFVAVMAAIVLLVIGLYRREMATCPRGVKIFLGVLRVAVVVVLALVFLGPAIIYTKTLTIDPVFVLMRDASFSMNHRDHYVNPRAATAAAAVSGRNVEALRAGVIARTELLDRALRRDNLAWMQKLNALGAVRVVDFATGAQQVALDAASERPGVNDGSDAGAESTNVAELPPLVATGQGTDLLNAITHGLAVPNVAAIVVMTDGQHTVDRSGNSELLDAAQKAREQGIPLLVVGVGDPTIATNVAVVDIYAPSEVLKDHPFEVQTQLRLQNVPVPTLNVELLRQRLDGNGQPIEELEVIDHSDQQVEPGASQIKVTFAPVVKKKGRYAYSVRVAPFPEEINTEDNQPKTTASVQVLDEMRVLLVAGQADWEYQLAKVLLYGESTVDLSCWLQNLDRRRRQEGNTPIDRLPDTPAALAEYDVVMLFDPDPARLPPGWIGQIKRLVADDSRGLFYLAGPTYSASFLAAAETSDAQKILPVDFGDVERLELESLGQNYQQEWIMDIAARNADLPIMSFYRDPQQSLSRWRSMPGFYWSFPATEAKPAARTLIERHERERSAPPRPLLVTGMYGSGRVVYMGFNGTWRWRRVPNDEKFYSSFWMQTIKYLVDGQSAASRGRGTLETDRKAYALGDRVRLHARRVKDEAYELLTDEKITVRIFAGGLAPESLELKAVPGTAGDYTASITAQSIGHYKVVVEQQVSGSDDELPTATFEVTEPQLENKEMWLNETLLNDLAATSGGAYFRLDQLDEILEKIPKDKAKQLRVKGQPHPLWDNSSVLLLLVGMLCCEWAVRKRYRLI